MDLAGAGILPPHDDALRLAMGVEDYSVVMLSPHFPGYPALILLARAIGTAAGIPAWEALIRVNAISWMLLFLAVFVLLQRRNGDGDFRAVGWGALLIAVQPLVVGAMVSGMSDLPGTSLLVACCAALLRKRYGLFVLAWILGVGVRPGLAPLWLILAVMAWVQARDLSFGRKTLWVSLAGAGVMSQVAWMWAHDGEALWVEGARFLRGHFGAWGTAWGETPRMNWGESLARYGLNGLILAAICMLPLLRHTGIRAARKKGFYGWLWAATAGWTLLAQNPEHLRHLLPVFVFACLWGLSHYRRLTAALLLAAALSGWIAAWQAPSSPPVWQAADLLGQQREGGVLLTRHGPEMLRQVLPSWRVLDPVWAGDAAVLARSGPVWRLTNRPPEMKPASVRTLPARWPTEETLYLTPPNAAEGRVFQN